jgi:hypothetical protein
MQTAICNFTTLAPRNKANSGKSETISNEMKTNSHKMEMKTHEIETNFPLFASRIETGVIGKVGN